MRIETKDLPQADRIESVVLATVAIANGATTDIEIANAVPGIEGDDRQGRYYRRAAQNLGFIVNHRNYSQITSLGQDIVSNPILTNPTLVSSVLNLNLFQKLIPFLELHPEGLSRREVIEYLGSIAVEDIGPTMIPRRISSIIAWIRSLGFVEIREDRIFFSSRGIPSLPILKINDLSQPLLPATGDLQEYETVQERMVGAGETITIYKNLAKQDRSNAAHRRLVNLVASRIRSAGAIPKSNVLIDLAANVGGDFLFEMKSCTETNIRAQIRKGLSQLYEYRYLQNTPNANLVLVLERPLNNTISWMIDYMEKDRDVLMVWDGNDELFGTVYTQQKLPFLSLQF